MFEKALKKLIFFDNVCGIKWPLFFQYKNYLKKNKGPKARGVFGYKLGAPPHISQFLPKKRIKALD